MLRQRLAFHFLSCAAALALLLAPPAAGAAAPRRVVVLPLGSLGVDEDVAASLLGFLRAEIAKLPGVAVVDLSKTGRIAGADCRGEDRCLAAAGARLGADEVVSGTVAGVGEAYSIDLKRISVRTGRDEARVTDTISGEREVLIDGIRGVAYKLLLPSQYAGTISLELAEADAEVFVDGRPAGKTPLKAPIGNLTPGKHALKIVKPGFADFDKWIDVRFARTSVVRVDLRNSAITGVMFEKEQPDAARDPAAATLSTSATVPAPPPRTLTGQRVGALVAGGLGLALGGGGVYFALASKDERAGARALQQGDAGVLPEDASEARGRLRAVRANSIAADAFWVGAGVAVAAGVVLWLTGADVAPALAPAVSAAPGGGAVGLVGTF